MCGAGCEKYISEGCFLGRVEGSSLRPLQPIKQQLVTLLAVCLRRSGGVTVVQNQPKPWTSLNRDSKVILREKHPRNVSQNKITYRLRAAPKTIPCPSGVELRHLPALRRIQSPITCLVALYSTNRPLTGTSVPSYGDILYDILTSYLFEKYVER